MALHNGELVVEHMFQKDVRAQDGSNEANILRSLIDIHRGVVMIASSTRQCMRDRR